MYYIEKSKRKREQPATETGREGNISQISVNIPKYTVEVTIGEQPIRMEVDTGAVVSVASERVYKQGLQKYPLKATAMELRDYHGAQLKLRGVIQVSVKYEEQNYQLPLVIVEGGRPILMGRNWLEVIKLNWKKICTIQTDPSAEEVHESVEEVLNRHSTVFEGGCGTIRQFKATIHLKPDARPVFKKNRPVPFAMKERISAELDRLETNQVLNKVERSDWATPTVNLLKKDQGIRICGDYKVTVNPMIDLERYPLPTAESIFATLAGGKQFTKLDLAHSYNQPEPDDLSKEYLTINTHQGLYRPNRLSFGVSSEPAIFQRVMDQILAGLDKVQCYLDDIILTAPSRKEHLQLLDEVLERLEKHGVRLKREKCAFLQDEVEYLGHVVKGQGIQPTKEKVKALQEAPRPVNESELSSYLDLLRYYARFLPGISTVLQPLDELQQAKSGWVWSEECEKAFQQGKEMILGAQVLCHYDTKKPIKLACDASSYGVGAVLSHMHDNGEERPIAFGSRKMTTAEKNYSQVAIIFGIKKFHKYLWGRTFTLETDHKLLVAIFGSKREVPVTAAARLQRWAILLSGHAYNIVYRKGTEIGHADAPSRRPLPETTPAISTPTEDDIFALVNELPVTSKEISTATRRDPVLAKVHEMIVSGWPNQMKDDNLKPYWSRRWELSQEQGCILWGARVVIPTTYRDRLLEDLHEGHMGISRMKSVARSYLWWPGMDQELELRARQCRVCQAVRNTPPVLPLQPWKWPDHPWRRVHVDYLVCRKRWNELLWYL